jgi:hypothetical protein
MNISGMYTHHITLYLCITCMCHQTLVIAKWSRQWVNGAYGYSNNIKPQQMGCTHQVPTSMLVLSPHAGTMHFAMTNVQQTPVLVPGNTKVHAS